MGLDTVELIIDVEKEFGISISDAAASQMQTIGDLADHLVQAIRADNASPLHDQPDLPEWVWQRVQALTAAQAGIRPEAVARQSHFINDLGFD